MTKEQAIQELKEAQKCQDPMDAHSDADAILCELLRSLGYSCVVDEWLLVDKWYS